LGSAKELGERKIIELILECLEQMPNMPIPFGDDASAVDMGNDKLAVINMDMLVGKTDVHVYCCCIFLLDCRDGL